MKAAVQAGLLIKSPCDGIRLPRIERAEMRFLDPHRGPGLGRRHRSPLPGDRAPGRLRRAAGPASCSDCGPSGSTRCAAPSPLPRPWSTSAVIPTSDPPKTRAGHRTIPLPRVAAEPLAKHLVTYGRKPDDLVFTAPEGGPVQLNVWRRRFWAPAVRGAGLAHLRPHDLRHTAVALWIAAGANPQRGGDPGRAHLGPASRSTATDTSSRAPNNG